MIKTHGLSHVALSVADPDRSLAFYRSVFGVREYFRDESTIQALGPGQYDVMAFERHRGGGHTVAGGIMHFGFRLIRPEDMDIASPEQGNLVWKVYSVEPTGDQTLVTTWAGEQFVVAKVDRAFRQAIDTPIAFKFRPDRVFLFDQASGARI